MTRRSRRLVLIAVALAVIGAAGGIALYALRDNIVFFYSPSEVAEKAVEPGARLRVGGLVKAGSVVKSQDQNVAFVVTDGAHDLKVAYQGLLPDLFREGQGVVAEGVLAAPGELRAETILAKHDERYMPREVVDALKKQGRWQEGEASAK
ncbi:MAG: cytochrome c maturation protein CcmE [Hyphomicrobiales bacterium]|nr:cytochrome c maturation protein CcmE [Hyphomicrobiales bacterium]MBV8440108.1 cytochrome c maturation protein CcmE [Hyphomicrobiales bacterium]